MSGDYPLHQLVFTRSIIGIWLMLIIVYFEGGLKILCTKRPFIHILRAVMLVLANLTYFVALAQLSIAEATAIFFVAPLFITLLGVPILGEKVGPLRIGAILVGLLGVILMTRPWEAADLRSVSMWVYILPIVAAFTYAVTQVLTRLLSTESKASALAIYVQIAFIIISTAIYLVAGDGRFTEGVTDQSLLFLLRAWTWPEGLDFWLMIVLGVNSTIIGYAFAQAYRQASAATVAPFEYIGLPLAIFAGWLVFDNLPSLVVYIGTGLIVGSGLFVYYRERVKSRT